MSPPSNASAPKVHEVAVKGFDSEPVAYESSRPSYPEDAVDCLEEHLGLRSGESAVLDLGAGSGKFTRLLASKNYHLTAVEPSPSMRATFADILPNVPILDGTAFAIPLESASQDAVIVAQAFHWFAQIETLREIHRVLKPGGRLGLVWNLEDRAAKKWVASLRDVYEMYEMGTPQYRLGLWKKVWQTAEAEELFSKLEDAHFEHETLCTEDLVWGRVCSKSYVACQSDEVKARLREQVLAILKSADDLERDPTFHELWKEGIRQLRIEPQSCPASARHLATSKHIPAVEFFLYSTAHFIT
ncbi:hypothetical protein AXG93_1502s1300 [Marchantia polymorpha subsp. ruderalis]|uniref:Methyltransferase type 11 domain-containing protein n=1 Tax=Marchantia polymorpha subsp. ruderalis TaxID=1480154 RepID=A0A176WCS7_MARPO|nr:hypothetical protein AXG93_1502s1300 [Marchantia polymorpha subsp. ruderalis]